MTKTNQLTEAFQKQQPLWDKVETFELGNPKARLAFDGKVAMENDWDRSFAQRAIMEYRRFLLLMMISDQRMAPSPAIDRVWHIHLTITQNYWDEFCTQIANQALHHVPATGNSDDRKSLKLAYQDTCSLYAKVFGDAPPREFWPKPSRRVAQSEVAQRIDRNRVVVISRSSILSWVGLGLLAVASIIFGVDMLSDGQLDLIEIFKDRRALIALAAVVLLPAILVFAIAQFLRKRDCEICGGIRCMKRAGNATGSFAEFHCRYCGATKAVKLSRGGDGGGGCGGCGGE